MYLFLKRISYYSITLKLRQEYSRSVAKPLGYLPSYSKLTMPPKIERIGEKSYELGEGPHWDADTQSLFYVDIFGMTIHRYTPGTNQTASVKFDKNVSIIIPVEGAPNKFVISLEREIGVITWDGVSSEVSNYQKIAELEDKASYKETRFNDGKADPSGRLWIGTMCVEKEMGHFTPNKGSLFSLDKKQLKTHLSPVSISNGLAWDANLKKFYYIDTLEGKIFQFDFDIEIGAITNQQTVFTLDKHGIPGIPDGQTIDVDGNLWVAIPNGSRVIKIDPRKPETLLETIEIPAKQVTSVAFGGKNLDELYVTTACLIIDGVELKPPIHGAVYRVTGLGTRGTNGVKVKL